MTNYTPTKFVYAICEFIDADVENWEGDKGDYINSKIGSYSAFQRYIFTDIWGMTGLNSLPDVLNDALKGDISSFKSNDALRWLKNYMEEDLLTNYYTSIITEKGNKMGVRHTIWGLDADVKIDFDAPHKYPTAKFIKNGNGVCCNAEDKKHPFEGKTWGDLWLAYDKVRGDDKCGHCFIEGFVLKGDTIVFHCGS